MPKKIDISKKKNQVSQEKKTTNGKHPMLVIDETIDYLKSLMSQTSMLGVKYH